MMAKNLINNTFADRLTSWYLRHKRDLPWRETGDPYRIWISEIVLQQTRVNQGLPYYFRFLEQFPDVISLAKAPERKVLKAWEGLGYYTRARNLHRCAKEIVKNRKGIFPDTYDQLVKLPGIGPYTAAAIASFAFHQNVAAVDGNVIRVITRLYRVNSDVIRSATRNTIAKLASQLLPAANAASFNQGMMELGSEICRPRNPLCDECPVSDYCQAYLKGDPLKYPVKTKKSSPRTRYFNYVVLKTNDRVVMRQRKENDIWKGLYEFLLVESDRVYDPSEIMRELPQNILRDPIIVYESAPFRHLLSHQEIVARFIEINQSSIGKLQDTSMRLYKSDEIESLPKSVLISKYLEHRII